jgi:hypothetical protein
MGLIKQAEAKGQGTPGLTPEQITGAIRWLVYGRQH